MVIVKATPESEAGQLPSTELLEAMGKYNEELAKAGIMLAGEGLQPSSKGARVRFKGSERSVVDGPFAETKELIAGFWLWEVRSMEEAIEWVKRCPNPMEGESEIEIRQVFEADDFGENLTPELREAEDRLREQIAERDRTILDAVNARLRLVDELKRHKEAEGIDFVDPEQEERLLQTLERANGGPLSREGVRRLFQEILALTKRELEA
jgi:chorismate mutase